MLSMGVCVVIEKRGLKPTGEGVLGLPVCPPAEGKALPVSHTQCGF